MIELNFKLSNDPSHIERVKLQESARNVLNSPLYTTDDIKSLDLTMVFMTIDKYLYMAIEDKDNVMIMGFVKLVQNTDYFAVNPLETNYGAGFRVVKTNKNAVDVDLITRHNICRDYTVYIFYNKEIGNV